jgi:chemotaxis protein histidine kinase CheA
MRRSAVLLLAVFLVAPGACRKEEAVEEAPATPETARSAAPQTQAAEAPSKAAPAATPVENRAPAIPRKLIRTVDLTLEVNNTQETAGKVAALVSGLGGYVAASNGQRQGGLMFYTMTVRVPVDRLDQALSAIRALAVRVNREHQQVEDVTDQYIDLDARLRTLEATETELRALLAESRQRARKVDEIMAVYQQLIEIRSQIEQIRTQLNSFDKLAAFSTLNLELVPTEAAKPVVAGGDWRPGDTVRSSARVLMALLRGLMDTAIFFVIVLVPVGLVILAVVVAVRWVVRKLRRRPATEIRP